MTEDEWLGSEDALKLLEFHHANFGKIARDLKPADRFHRKGRLFACACCYYVIECAKSGSARSIEIAEQFADGEVNKRALEAERRSLAIPGWASRPFIVTDAINSLLRSPLAVAHVMQICTASAHDWKWFSAFARDILGNPFRPVPFGPRWRTSDVNGLARSIYGDRAFDRMPILADALMDAGCADEQFLSHCRGAGPHVRGCWVVDLVLGKE
jgi:hypothetical protein